MTNTTSKAEKLYLELGGIQDSDELLEIMDRAYDSSVSQSIDGDNALFVFDDGSYLKTSLQGNHLGTWHGWVANQIH